MSQTTNLGKVCVTPKGTHNPAITYAILDIVTDNGSSYIAIKDVPVNIAITNTSYWQLIAAKGGAGEITDVTASISGGYGTPGVTVTEGGTTTEKTLAFAFTNLVGNGVSSITGEKTGTSGNVDTYTMTITYDSGDTDTVTYTVTNGSVTSVDGKTGDVTLDDVVRIDGDYSETSTTVGYAKKILPVSPESGTTQDAPFIAQGTGTSNNTNAVDTGEYAQQLEKNGNTIVYNQKVQNGNFESTSGWSPVRGTIAASNNVLSYTITEVAGDYGSNRISRFIEPIPTGHIALVSGQIKALHDGVGRIALRNGDTVDSVNFNLATGNNILTGIVQSSNNDNEIYIGFNSADGGYSVGEVVEFRNVYAVDLTQWFNGDIPQDLLDNPSHFSWYYNGSLAYDAGSLQDCNGRYLVCTHRQLWDEDWEVGYIDTNDGQDLSGYTDRIRGKNYCKAISNTMYYVRIPTGTLSVYWYDEDYNYVGLNYGVANTTIASPANASYFRICTLATYGATYNHDITISKYYSPEEGGEGYNQYYPYVAPNVYDTGTEVLRSAGSAKDVKVPSGVITRNILPVKPKNLEWTYASGFFLADVSDAKMQIGYITPANIQCADYTADIWSHTGNASYDKIIAVSYASHTIGINDSDFSDATTFKNHFGNDEYIYLEADTPTTEQGTEFPENIGVNDYGIMYWLDTDNNLVSIPQGCKVFYPADYTLWTDTAVARTQGDANNIALISEIDDTALNTRGYYKTQDLSSGITDVAGLTYTAKKAYKCGNVVTIYVNAINETGNAIAQGSTLFDVPAPLVYSVLEVRANAQFMKCDITDGGEVVLGAELPNSAGIFISFTYAVA